MKTYPKCSGIETGELLITLYSVPLSKICDLCDVKPSTVDSWRAGKTETPKAVYHLLKLVGCGTMPPGMGHWSGWMLDGERLYIPGDKRGIRYEELVCIDHYRLNEDLVKRQAELIEVLEKQRRFYAKQCALEAKTGLMLANIIGNKG